ncbi:MAG: threonine--tRNA ligase, partial [Candidatus Andersenbacteria bacterium]|nr:threonine--tRNA ligase [Candidatus Andersenbacteria bacterium]
VGPGLPIIMKNGMVLWNGMANHLRKMMRKYYRGNVHELHTAHIGSQKLYEISGHWEKYKDDNFPPMQLDDRAYMMKPMNCPHHIQAFTHKPLSYRDLPFRTFEIGTAYRLEQSGELSGLTRVRSLSIDDAHLFVANEEQLKEEIRLLLLIVKETYDKLGLNDYRATLSVRDPKTPEKYIGNPKDWDHAEQALADALEENDALLPGNGYDREEGEAAFYGPKIDLKFRDALGREHQLSTIQVDYNFPERFDLTYVGEDGDHHRPIMIHRALLGSMERFMGIYIEHTGGAFPTWLAPTQVLLLPVSDESVDYARAIEAQLFDAGVRVEIDDSKESVGKKIRNGVSKKAPYMIVIGEQEKESGVFPIRVRGSQETEDMSMDAFVSRLAEEDDSIRPSL